MSAFKSLSELIFSDSPLFLKSNLSEPADLGIACGVKSAKPLSSLDGLLCISLIIEFKDDFCLDIGFLMVLFLANFFFSVIENSLLLLLLSLLSLKSEYAKEVLMSTI